ncbi:MAG: PAS domain S-box protein [Chloroflexota bacterium]
MDELQPGMNFTESSELLTAILQAMAEPVLIYYAGQEAVFANSSAIEMLGFDPRGMDRQALLERIALSDLEGRPTEYPRLPGTHALNGKRVRGRPTLLRNAFGQEFSVMVSAAPVYAGEQLIAAVVVWTDVTALRSAEQALQRLLDEVRQQRSQAEHKAVEVQRQAAQLRAVIMAMVDPVVIYDPPGTAVLTNEATRRMYGFDPVGMQRLDLARRINLRTMDDRPLDPAELPSSRALDGEVVSGEMYRLTGQAGQVYVVETSAAPIPLGTEYVGVATVWHNVTERMQADEALRASEKRFRELADSMPQLVWTAQPDGQVDYYNQRYREYAGIEPGQDGQVWNWAPVLHPDDRQATVDAWAKALSTGATYQAEHRVRMADGSYCWHLSRGIPAFDEQGRVVRWYGTATNIHDQKQAEMELQTYARKLEQSNRDLQEFAFVASHDLQEPLRKIEAFGDALLNETSGLDQRQRSYLERMRAAAGRMRRMVDDLLKLSRVTTQAAPFQPVDLTRVALEVVSDLEILARRSGGQVQIEPLPVVQADEIQMRQLFQNLIGNGLKFRHAGRPPLVRVYPTPPGERRADGRVEIIVEDNGIGFEQQDAEKIFQPFQRLVGRSEYDGSGMGLAICRKIVERHNGRLTASSRPGEGTRFIISLPG